MTKPKICKTCRFADHLPVENEEEFKCLNEQSHYFKQPRYECDGCHDWEEDDE